MPGGARRLPVLLLPAFARRALLTLGVWLAMLDAADACRMSPWNRSDVVPGSVVIGEGERAWFSGLTNRYAHGVLGDTSEPTRLHFWDVATSAQCGLVVDAGARHVFEDIAPRLADLDGNGHHEVIVVRSHESKGAQLVVYGVRGGTLRAVANTPYIGTKFRWLAPVSAADLDGDGHMEIAYIDRPHLAKTLRIWRYSDGALIHVADQPGLTNHRIGQDFISGGIRSCGTSPEIITANANWTRVMASTLSQGRITTRDIGAFNGAASLTTALTCP